MLATSNVVTETLFIKYMKKHHNIVLLKENNSFSKTWNIVILDMDKVNMLNATEL